MTSLHLPHAAPLPGPALVCLNLPADPRYLNIVSACLGALIERMDAVSQRDTVTYNVQLAVHEACVNIVEHAYGGLAQDVGQGRIAVEISVGGAPRRIVVDLYDEGLPFAGLPDDLAGGESISTLPPAPQEPQVRGYGLLLMRGLLEEVRYERVSDRNHWRLATRL